MRRSLNQCFLGLPAIFIGWALPNFPQTLIVTLWTVPTLRLLIMVTTEPYCHIKTTSCIVNVSARIVNASTYIVNASTYIVNVSAYIVNASACIVNASACIVNVSAYIVNASACIVNASACIVNASAYKNKAALLQLSHTSKYILFT
ncbi:hypothetical protein ACF3DV_02925 [Chlorogloeopsis fritschii PCC 9212]|uniref:hypothetical protein n=1 Tax=Chlorogloeopsis fritschii TaxID=1124 RepID=UPI00138AEBED|nr:hypothetical protein [Chlorogloeopsis fritschii]